MSKYSIYATKEDYQKAYSELKEIEPKLSYKLDWKKIKRINLDSLSYLISALKRSINK
jgi:hypothetical protein